jgi:hypothetical protein
MLPAAPLPVDHHQPRPVARLDRMLCDQLVRQIEIE